MMAAPDEAWARAMTLPTLYGRIRELAEDPRSASTAERVALLQEASARLFAADLLLNGVPDDGLVSWVAFLTDENLRELVQGGVSGDFDDVRATMNELEDQMRGDA